MRARRHRWSTSPPSGLQPLLLTNLLIAEAWLTHAGAGVGAVTLGGLFGGAPKLDVLLLVMVSDKACVCRCVVAVQFVSVRAPTAPEQLQLLARLNWWRWHPPPRIHPMANERPSRSYNAFSTKVVYDRDSQDVAGTKRRQRT